MSLVRQLKELAQVPRATTAFFSVYLDTRWHDEKQRERVRIFVKTARKECLAAHGQSDSSLPPTVQEDLDKLSRYLRGLIDREWDEECAGVALFACGERDIYQVVRSHQPFADAWHCAPFPVLRPAAELVHQGQGGLLALVAADGGQVLQFAWGQPGRQVSLRDAPLPGSEASGERSQARYRRQLDEHQHRTVKRLAEHLVRWADEQGEGPVLLAGPDALVAAFEEQLPKRILTRVWARLRPDPAAPPTALLRLAFDTVAAEQVVRDHDAVAALLDRSGGKGRAAVGPEAVAEAVTAGHCYRLYLDRGFRERGWACLDCGALGAKVPLGCPGCGAAVESVDLGEALVRTTLAGGGAVVPVAEVPGLLRVGGVAARLRH